MFLRQAKYFMIVQTSRYSRSPRVREIVHLSVLILSAASDSQIYTAKLRNLIFCPLLLLFLNPTGVLDCT
jgi:hypothetical protein